MSSTLRQYPMWVGVVTLILSIISLCTGTSFAKTLFTEVGAIGTTTFRIFFSACILWLIWRPWRIPVTRSDLATIVPYGICIVGMNLPFYLSLQTLPVGIALAIEFTGPESAFDNINKCFEAGVPVVSGSTGWLKQYDEAVWNCKEQNGAFLYASNFSIGVNIFFEIKNMHFYRPGSTTCSWPETYVHHAFEQMGVIGNLYFNSINSIRRN